VPVERQRRAPLQRRDLVLLAVLGALAAVAVAAGAWIAVARDGSQAGGRCVDVTLASTMGGATVHRCGADAARFCRREAPRSAQVATACDRAGFRVR
jgi:predicted metal-binding membrane protein